MRVQQWRRSWRCCLSLTSRRLRISCISASSFPSVRSENCCRRTTDCCSGEKSSGMQFGQNIATVSYLCSATSRICCLSRAVHRGPLFGLGCSSSLCWLTLACRHIATRSPSLPFLWPPSPVIHVHTIHWLLLICHPGVMEGQVGLVRWPIVYSPSGHLSS